MAETGKQSFPPEVIRELKSYVYRLIDPRNGETFYVGKGKGNRVYDHANGLPDAVGKDDIGKFRRIREIRQLDLIVQHVIHRHGMTDATAKEVEAALIDAYPGLTNQVAGIGSSLRGSMHAAEIVRRYEAKEAEFSDKVLLININRSALEQVSIYEATRYSWKLSKREAKKAEYVLAVRQGMILEAFVPEAWLDATTENFPEREDSPGRFGFVGRIAPENIRKKYVGKKLPASYRKRGATNPIRYSWK